MLTRFSKIVLVPMAIAALSCIPAFGGTIFLTGHDDDFHDNSGSSAGAAQLAAAVSFVRNGSSLPVLTFDSGTELTSDLTKLGVAFTNVNPNTAGAVTAALFNPATYSAFIVASDTSCGGCDNSPAGEANIAAQITAIDAFLNAGGGILGFAGANSLAYYSFVPQTATSVGGAPSTGYTATALGTSLGLPATNGDPTHNLFFNPGVSGESSAYQIVELNTTTGNGTILPPAAVSLVCVSCTVGGGIIVSGTPEPATWGTMASALVAVGGFVTVRRRRSRRNAA